MHACVQPMHHSLGTSWRVRHGLMFLVLLALALERTAARRKTAGGLPHASVLPSDPSTLDVWILAGQSNMGGENSNDGEEWPHPLGDPLPSKILMFPNATGVWRDAENNMCAKSNGCERCDNSLGPAMAFGRTMLQLRLAWRVGFVPTSLGGSSLFFHWAAPDGIRYRFMIDSTLAAMAAAGPKAHLRGLLWVQGESDGSPLVPPDSAAKYGERLRTFINSVRSDLSAHHPLLPVVVVKMSLTNRSVALPTLGLVRQHQEDVIATVPAIIGADQQGCKFYMQDLGKDMGGPTDMHLTKSGVCQLGAQMARRYAASGQQMVRPGEAPDWPQLYHHELGTGEQNEHENGADSR